MPIKAIPSRRRLLLLAGAAVAAALASVGWQGWQWYQGKQTAEASALYAVLQKAASEKNTQKSREAAGALIEKYNGTAYADMAALLSAKVQAEAGGPELDAIAFNVDLAVWPDASIQWVELGYRLDINEWRNQRSVQLLVSLLRPQ